MTHLILTRYLSTASRLKKVPAHHQQHPAVQQQQYPHNSRSHENSQQHHYNQQQHVGSEDKKSRKSKILEVISFKKSPSISSKEKEAKKIQRPEPRPLEPVEIAHIETLKVCAYRFELT